MTSQLSQNRAARISSRTCSVSVQTSTHPTVGPTSWIMHRGKRSAQSTMRSCSAWRASPMPKPGCVSPTTRKPNVRKQACVSEAFLSSVRFRTVPCPRDDHSHKVRCTPVGTASNELDSAEQIPALGVPLLAAQSSLKFQHSHHSTDAALLPSAPVAPRRHAH